MIIPEPTENSFRVAIVSDGPGVTAICLDRFIAAPGADETEALTALERGLWWQTYLDRQAGVVPFSNLRPAPSVYEDVALNVIEGFSVDYSQDFAVPGEE